MTRIYMLNAPFVPNFNRQLRGEGMSTRGGTLYYPIWLSYATGILEEHHEVKLVDAVAKNWNMNKVLQDAKKFSPEIIVIDSNFASLNNDLKVANMLKSEIGSTIILVGPPTSQFPEKMLDDGVDIIARYEYDFTLAELAERMEKRERFDDVPGVSLKQNGRVIHNPNRPWSTSGELDKLPYVSEVYKRHLNIYNYYLNYSLYPMVQVFTGRGCPHKCTFCSWPQILTGRKYRVRSVENVLDELEWIEGKSPEVKEVFFEDDTFTISKNRVLEFCKGYMERGLDISWSCNARADTLDLETMKMMKKANCRFLIVGFESANDEILKNIRKGFTVEQARGFAKNVKKAGLLLHADFIIGLPGETKETIEMTKDLIKEVKPDILQVQVATPLPGTEFYKWCKENGYLLTDDPNEYLDEQGHQKAIFSYPELSNDEMVKEVDKILKDYYISLSYVPLALRQVFRKHGFDEMRRLWYSVRMFWGYIGGRGE